MVVGASKPLPARSHDYIYDPLFVVSGVKDHYKEMSLARISTAKFAAFQQICPIFDNMFSDVPNHPRKQYVRRKSAPSPYVRAHKAKLLLNMNITSFHAKPADVAGADRYKFFQYPDKIKLSIATIPPLAMGSISGTTQIAGENPRKMPAKQSKKTQTQYRESSAQTSPWEPAFKVTDDTDPELLKMDFLKWGDGLPPGGHEVQMIERARMKRAWEALCDVQDEEDMEKRKKIISAMERDEWAFREKEIQDLQNLRLELLEKMLGELHEKAKCRSEAKLKMFTERKLAEKEKKLKKLRESTKREMRKLDMKQAGIISKYHPVNIVEEHADRAQEIYGPMMRHGEHPKRWHQIIDDKLKIFNLKYAGVENLDTLPTWIDNAPKIKDCCCLKLPGTRLCMRETKWTTPVLKKLHEELVALRRHDGSSCHLLQRIESPPSSISTPEVEAIGETEEDFYQAMILIQSVIKGRAAQMHIYEGRERCRELIEELKYSAGLLDEENAIINDYKLKIKLEQREEQIEEQKGLQVQERLDKLQGVVVGSLLDFLNKELRRLLEERRAHAICILLERERYDREAAEAGRRQVELRRRREHDEMFRQVVKVEQETIDLYLEDIIREGMEFTSEEEAKDYIKRLGMRIDEETYKAYEENKATLTEDQEMIADLVHHFVMPDVAKNLVRTRMQNRQKEKLRAVHDTVYEEIEDISLARLAEQEEEE